MSTETDSFRNAQEVPPLKLGKVKSFSVQPADVRTDGKRLNRAATFQYDTEPLERGEAEEGLAYEREKTRRTLVFVTAVVDRVRLRVHDPAWRETRPGGRRIRSLTDVFRLVDADRDGRISPRDLHAQLPVLLDGVELSDDQINAVFQVIDSAKKGHISNSVFTAVFSPRNKDKEDQGAASYGALPVWGMDGFKFGQGRKGPGRGERGVGYYDTPQGERGPGFYMGRRSHRSKQHDDRDLSGHGDHRVNVIKWGQGGDRRGARRGGKRGMCDEGEEEYDWEEEEGDWERSDLDSAERRRRVAAEERAAVKIQAGYRGWDVRRRMRQEQHDRVARIQAHWRGFVSRRLCYHLAMASKYHSIQDSRGPSKAKYRIRRGPRQLCGAGCACGAKCSSRKRAPGPRKLRASIHTARIMVRSGNANVKEPNGWKHAHRKTKLVLPLINASSLDQGRSYVPRPPPPRNVSPTGLPQIREA